MGILEFVFGKSAPKDDTAPKQAYYLNDDDAKTFGNIDYMRSSKTVRRTFAKKKGQAEHMESVRQISSTAAKVIDANTNFSTSSQPAATFSSFSTPSVAPKTESTAPAAESTAPAVESTPAPARRKPASSDMDMFRNMAKDIRK
ncbi:hypothetical protein S7335_4433 [Synechococcus sp. PCC 7335]|uniref:hypothetical protein n=1 Tax=Synechococcus sp. (strain ATCC 29403 / PCC 7335) TaxID=91464 RepID=UPI00017EC012|nr:hypothetical protein [Synechococcus sp. PCC 7335]EDX86727.1 hypothetical protein S7335_4433 [Synechococcus sp. PCC 7335]